MELSIFPSPLHLVLFFVPLSLILLLIYKPKSSSPAKLPPGKTGWPIVGETLEYILAGRSGNPETFINDRTRKHSRTDVFKTSLFGEKMAVFCGAAGNKFLFSNENKIVTTWWPQSTMKVLHIPSHIQKSSKGESKNVATFLGEFLKPETLQHYVPIMDSAAKQHIEEKWAQNSEVKVFPLSKNYTFALAGQLFMKINDPKHLAKVSDPFALVTAGLTSVPLNFPGTAFNRAIKASKIVIEELAAIIKQRKMELSEKRGSEGIDLLTRMLLFRDENGKFMNEIEISSQIMGLLIASHDTTSTAITFVVNYLAEFPDIYSKVLKEQMEIAKSKGQGELLSWDDIQKMKYSWCVANEAMRLASPSQGSFREAKIDFTYAGFTIPKGWKTHWTTYSTHKNPIYFPNPEKFDPSRFGGKGPTPYTFVPFGGGPRMCPGREYARLEILVFMHNVVTRFKFKKIIPDEKITYNPSPIPVNGLPVRLQPHEK